MEGPHMVLMFFICLIALIVTVWCMLFSRLGYSWAGGLFMVLPVVGLIVLCVVAFSRSPNEARILELKRRLRRYEEREEGLELEYAAQS